MSIGMESSPEFNGFEKNHHEWNRMQLRKIADRILELIPKGKGSILSLSAFVASFLTSQTV